MDRVAVGCRKSHTLRLQSPEADKNTSACAGLLHPQLVNLSLCVPLCIKATWLTYADADLDIPADAVSNFRLICSDLQSGPVQKPNRKSEACLCWTLIQSGMHTCMSTASMCQGVSMIMTLLTSWQHTHSRCALRRWKPTEAGVYPTA